MTSKKILFLDDDPKRTKQFLSHYPAATCVTSSSACIAQLALAWDEIRLDHDLGGEIYVDSQRVDCGMEVVRYICEHCPEHLQRTRFIIHSYNDSAALLMCSKLQECGYSAVYVPFGYDLT
jgi:hypothetical protein